MPLRPSIRYLSMLVQPASLYSMLIALVTKINLSPAFPQTSFSIFLTLGHKGFTTNMLICLNFPVYSHRRNSIWTAS